MNRREFLNGAIGTAIGTGLVTAIGAESPLQKQQDFALADMRTQFPRLRNEVFLNAAGGTPLAEFTSAGLEKYQEFWRLGPGEDRGMEFATTIEGCRSSFASLIGATADEIAFVSCTKAGEQIVLDGLPTLREGGNLVTNDLHFTGSLHNLVGLKQSGVDVRIVRNDDWQVGIDKMRAAMDDRTSLVCVSLVSNINGHIEPIKQLAAAAHGCGAVVYADIIQAAGIIPINVRELGIDFAACSSYKWLFGPHGAGFFFARKELQGDAVVDRMFPGHVRHNYPPWIAEQSAGGEDYVYQAPDAAARYQPGHVSYLGYYGVYEALRVIEQLGVAQMRDHSTRLIQRLTTGIDARKYRNITPAETASPMATFLVEQPEALLQRLAENNITVSLANNRMRVSPSIYNTEDDIDRLLKVINS